MHLVEWGEIHPGVMPLSPRRFCSIEFGP